MQQAHTCVDRPNRPCDACQAGDLLPTAPAPPPICPRGNKAVQIYDGDKLFVIIELRKPVGITGATHMAYTYEIGNRSGMLECVETERLTETQVKMLTGEGETTLPFGYRTSKERIDDVFYDEFSSDKPA